MGGIEPRQVVIRAAGVVEIPLNVRTDSVARAKARARTLGGRQGVDVDALTRLDGGLVVEQPTCAETEKSRRASSAVIKWNPIVLALSSSVQGDPRITEPRTFSMGLLFQRQLEKRQDFFLP